MSSPFSFDWYANQSAEELAVSLLGRILCRRSREGLTTGRIVETEAYLSAGDSAAHSFVGPNKKNAAMFGPPGRAYVYTIHARQCFNIVTEEIGHGSAVLVRAVEPLRGLALMRERRGTEKKRDLCRGPARLCEAFSIGREFNGWDLSRGQRLWITEADDYVPPQIRVSPRIGVTSAETTLLRFFAADNPFVSGTNVFNATAQEWPLTD